MLLRYYRAPQKTSLLWRRVVYNFFVYLAVGRPPRAQLRAPHTFIQLLELIVEGRAHNLELRLPSKRGAFAYKPLRLVNNTARCIQTTT